MVLSTMNRRNNYQVIGYWLNEPVLQKPELAIEAVKNIAEEGYDLIRVFLRNSNFTHTSPKVIDLIGKMTETAHENGIKIAIDCEPHYLPLARELGSLYPESMGCRLVRGTCTVVNGYFTIHAQFPSTWASIPIFSGVEAAFLEHNGAIEKVKDFEYKSECVNEAYDLGHTLKDVPIMPGRPGLQQRFVHLRGRIGSVRRARLTAYIRFEDIGMIDFWASGARHYYDHLLDCYKDIPLDGVGWDEPAAKADWNAYVYGQAFADKFKLRNGYELSDRIYELDNRELTPKAIATRLDYYSTLNEGLYDFQQHFITRARKYFGPEIITGTHHTWQGEGAIGDYRAGAVDYFRLNENMDAGYTDSCWWDDSQVCYVYALAASLGNKTPSGTAECNNWSWKPTNEQIDYYSRLMAMMKVNWFNIWYGENEDTCRYPEHYTWETATSAMRRLKLVKSELDGFHAVTDASILHDWQGVMAVNRPEWANVHKAFLINTSQMLLQENVAFDFINMDDLPKPSSRLIIIPYGVFLTRDAWDGLVSASEHGSTVIFVGIPPGYDENGQDLSTDFAEIMGITKLEAEDYIDYIDSIATLPHTYRPIDLELSYPINGTTGITSTSVENEINLVAAPNKTMFYFSEMLPKNELLDLIKETIPSQIQCCSDSILWKMYQKEDQELVVVISRRRKYLSGLLEWKGQQVKFSGKHTIALLNKNKNGNIEVKYY